MDGESEKDALIKCCTFVDTLVDIVKHQDNCIEILLDYSLTRYPYLSITLYLLDCKNIRNSWSNLLYTDVLSITMKIETLYKNNINLFEDIILLKIGCEDSWLEYGYVVSKSFSGIYNVVKGWSIGCNGKKNVLKVSREDICGNILELVAEIVRKTKMIMESEGMI
ncbi:MAG: hypothetical protein QXG46_03205 [Ignisphaera sp.]